MARVEGWERKLNAVIRKHRDLPAEYGVSDCFLICADAVEAITGTDPFPHCRTAYKTIARGIAVLRREGFADMEAAWASKFEKIGVLEAQRGDIAILDTPEGPAGGVVTSAGIVIKVQGGTSAVVPYMNARAAYRVE